MAAGPQIVDYVKFKGEFIVIISLFTTLSCPGDSEGTRVVSRAGFLDQNRA